MDEKRMLLESAFPGQTFDDDQVKAFGEFVRMCMEPESDEDYEDGEESGEGSDSDIALILGAGPKKGSK